MFEPGAGLLVGGKYELGVLLGRGGMGSVWGAEHTALGSQVAVKFISPDLVNARDARARFEREARSAAQISSPHVVHVYDHGVEDGLPFIVMEMLEGEDLGVRIRRHGLIELPEAKRIIHQIAKGLGRAHEHGIVHRDLKPANVFLCTRDDDMVKILDFGVARPVQRPQGAEVTATGMLLGSPQYMSPEQARGGKVDSRSDLWSVAVVAYRMLTGERPFLGTEVGDIIVRLSVDPHIPATQNRPTLHEDVDQFFDKALAKKKEDRFQTAAEMSAAFAALPNAGESSVKRRRNVPKTLPTVPRDSVHAVEAASQGSITATVTATSATSSRRGNTGTAFLLGGVVVLALGIGIASAMSWSATDAEGEPSPAISTSPEQASAAVASSVQASSDKPLASADAAASSTVASPSASVAAAPADPRTPRGAWVPPSRPAPPKPANAGRSIFKKRK